MSRSNAGQAARLKFSELSAELVGIGFVVEPYIVGPTGLGVLCLEVSTEVSAYVSFSYFNRYQAIGTYVGFAFPELKSITDKCLLVIGRSIGITPTYALAQPCPAVLFPLEFFVPSPDGQPFKVSALLGPLVRQVVYERVLNGSHAWINSRQRLCEFLVSNEMPFSWEVSEVPRRLVQAGYLLSYQGTPYEVARNLLGPAASALRGDGDFDTYTGDLIEEILTYFYQNDTR